MLSRTETVALEGIKGTRVTIETDIDKGLPYFTVIGLGDTAVKEASERVRRAIINSGFKYPKGRITVNLSPAYIHKRGSHYDLGIAIGILKACGEIIGKKKKRLLIGELALDGTVLAVKGALPMAVSAVKAGFEEILLPEANCQEAGLIAGKCKTKLIPVRTLEEAAGHIAGSAPIKEYKGREGGHFCSYPDFADVKGNSAAKAAIAAAMAGAHSLLMVGAPGTGKTMLARRAPGLLPPMSLGEQLETSAIYSAAGMLNKDVPVIRERPFRQVSCLTTRAQLLGGGNLPLPGEVSFAHNGILFADEMLEMKREILESMREPLEEKQVRLTRRGKITVFPAGFLFIGAANPCRCGFLGDSLRKCTCSQADIERYRSRLSGPLADRLDMCIEICRADYYELKGGEEQSTAQLRKKVENARNIQQKRFDGLEISYNSQMTAKTVDEFCVMEKGARRLAKKIYQNFGISARRYHKILKLSRTLADMDMADNIEEEHIASAFHYTRLLTKGEKRLI